LILSAVSRGWLVSLGRRGRGSREYWYAPGVFDVMNAPMAYASSWQALKSGGQVFR